MSKLEKLRGSSAGVTHGSAPGAKKTTESALTNVATLFVLLFFWPHATIKRRAPTSAAVL